jgi:diguanylate cyclase (GGDEF)-like protein
MDPASVFVIAVLMMLLNGGVLGLVHRSLAPQAQPAAVSWRIGTLLMAGGAALLVVQGALPPGFILPVANACLLGGMTLHWRAVRQFHDLPDRAWLALPVVVGVVGIYVFAAWTPVLSARVVISALASGAIALGAAFTLQQHGRRYAAVSSAVLRSIFYATALITLARGGYFAWHWQTTASVIDPKLWVNFLTPMAAGVLPIIGTTAFLLMCAERLRGELERAASTDELTGLPNRRSMTREGEARFAAARAGAHSFAVAVIDVDHFKRVNDRHGHELGDLALKHVASVLHAACRTQDLLGRQGGEEFVALLHVGRDDDMRALGERLRLAIGEMPLQHEAMHLAITVSIGIGTATPRDSGYEQVLRRADQALYAAKAAGRDCVVVQAM